MTTTMNAVSSAHPRVTILMTVRERHALTEQALESIVSNTFQPYRLIFADVMCPAWLRERLAEKSVEWNLEVIRFEEPLWPHEVRRKLAGIIDTDYIVYIDNDVLVEPDWLGKLLECAEETGAGLVGPLYLWGDGKLQPTIHMAGGVLTEKLDKGGRVLGEAHRFCNKYPQDVSEELYRQPCDFLEYHCMLVRSSLLGEGRLFDENICCVHEHIDTALSVKKLGYPVYFEPDSHVTYLAFADYQLEDLALFRKRWSREAGEASIRAFADKWEVIDDEQSFGGVRGFLNKHLTQTDPIRILVNPLNDHETVMERHELAQTRADLLDQAAKRGYGKEALALIAKAYRLAQFYMNGSYRPCGRPFINHLVGTASVLVRYDFRIEAVLAGLLHTLYSHRPHRLAGTAGIREISQLLGGYDHPVEKRVRGYAMRGQSGKGLQSLTNGKSGLSLFDAEIVGIAAANEVDMYLSGEYRYTRREDPGLLPEMALITHVCKALEVPGLSATLMHEVQSPNDISQELKTIPVRSYRIHEGEYQPMRCEGITHRDFAGLEQARLKTQA